MGVNKQIYGMIGLNLPDNDETEQRFLDGLGITPEVFEEKYDCSIFDMFSQKGLTMRFYEDGCAGTYRFVGDGMSGKYIRVGLVLFEGDDSAGHDKVNVDYVHNFDMNYKALTHTLKVIFGIESTVDDIRLMVFTHYC